MWKIFLFIESRILYPIYFTVCFAVYYLSYIIFMFELPKINFVNEFKDNDISSDGRISAIAHILCVFITGLIIMFCIIGKYFIK